ncbi:FadR/GntR family transcriptional regulator [Actinomadura formosensis]|uniref:FadR/GntR family transcriptional regulator n=1 Tax=Actinomadura formosensis TaxID=60706 RepID=UPI00082F7147|nr:FadR/GntR family transcriptional regulator [Actinomadura formosensis]
MTDHPPAGEDTAPAMPTGTPDLFAEIFAEDESPDLHPLFQPLQMPSAGELIADRLVTAIALGGFVPGQRLPSERDLAAMLEVSRSSVREAIQRLGAEGYVTVRRGRTGGVFVTTSWGPNSAEKIRRTLLPTWKAMEQVLDCRACTEEMIAGMAARRRTDDDVTAIQDALEAYRAADDDREASRAADEAFHLAVVRATHNVYLVKLSQRLRHVVNLGFRSEPYSRELRRTALHQHASLAEAIIGGRDGEAGAIAAGHFTLTTESTLRDLVARIREDGQAPEGETTPPAPDHD